MCFPTMEEAFPCSTVPLLHVDKLPPPRAVVRALQSRGGGLRSALSPRDRLHCSRRVFRLCAGWEWLGLLWKTVFTTKENLPVLSWVPSLSFGWRQLSANIQLSREARCSHLAAVALQPSYPKQLITIARSSEVCTMEVKQSPTRAG